MCCQRNQMTDPCHMLFLNMQCWKSKLSFYSGKKKVLVTLNLLFLLCLLPQTPINLYSMCCVISSHVKHRDVIKAIRLHRITALPHCALSCVTLSCNVCTPEPEPELFSYLSATVDEKRIHCFMLPLLSSPIC